MANAARPTLEQVAAAEAERAVEPYRALIPEEDLEAFKEILRDELLAHPASAQMLRMIQPPPVVQESGDVDRETGLPVEEREQTSIKSKSGRR